MHLKRIIIPVLLSLAIFLPMAVAQHAEMTTDSKSIDLERLSKVKAAFLLNFFKFTTWTDSRFESANSNFNVVLIGEDDIGSVLDATLRGRDWHGHPISINRISAGTRIDIATTHVVYIAPSSGISDNEIQTYLQGGILVIGYDRNIVRSGAILGFSVDEGKVGFFYSGASLKRSTLQISSKLLSLGKAVE